MEKKTADAIASIVDEAEPILLEARRQFHRYPELSRQERRTAKYIRSKLEEWGIPYFTNDVGNTVAVIEGRVGKETCVEADKDIGKEIGKGVNKGKVIAIRGDIDALPITEETGSPYASCIPGVMHACGHDCHGAFMLGSAWALNRLKDSFSGTVKVIFQEAEETGEGALSLLETDILDDVQRIVGLHISQEYDLGTFQLGYGIMSAIGRGAKMTFTGGGSDEDRVLAAVSCIEMVSGEAMKRFTPGHHTVLVPTVIKTLPGEEVHLTLNFRTLTPEDEPVFEQICTDICSMAAARHKVEGSWVSTGRDEGVWNDKESTDLAVKVIKETFGDEAAMLRRPYTSGEDFAYYQQKIPGVMVHIGGATNGNYLPLHTSKTMVDDGVLRLGTQFFLMYIFEYLCDSVNIK